jgi:hypothetical protein
VFRFPETSIVTPEVTAFPSRDFSTGHILLSTRNQQLMLSHISSVFFTKFDQRGLNQEQERGRESQTSSATEVSVH